VAAVRLVRLVIPADPSAWQLAEPDAVEALCLILAERSGKAMFLAWQATHIMRGPPLDLLRSNVFRAPYSPDLASSISKRGSNFMSVVDKS
jgi:hypothetical protein